MRAAEGRPPTTPAPIHLAAVRAAGLVADTVGWVGAEKGLSLGIR
jgi:hypothetical protein